MIKLITALMLALPLAAGKAFAQDKKEAPKAEAKKEEKKEMTAQQKKMGDCASQAKSLKGDEYKKTRAECMSKQFFRNKKAR